MSHSGFGANQYEHEAPLIAPSRATSAQSVRSEAARREPQPAVAPANAAGQPGVDEDAFPQLLLTAAAGRVASAQPQQPSDTEVLQQLLVDEDDLVQFQREHVCLPLPCLFQK